MKPQDVIFLIILVVLLVKKTPKWFVVSGLVCLAASIPFFAFWVFFTAERLIYYASAFILASIILYLIYDR